MNQEQITREVRSAEVASLDAEVRAIRLAKIADSITSGMSLGHLDEVMRGLVVERARYVRDSTHPLDDGSWYVTVKIDQGGEVPRSGFGPTLFEALADAVRSLATMQTVRAAEKRKLAARWLESMEVENGSV